MSAIIERRWDTDAFVVALVVNRAGTFAAAALGDGSVRLIDLGDPDGSPRVIQAHEGVCRTLACDLDDEGFLSGGDDGRVWRIAPGAEPVLLAEAKGCWIEAIDATPHAGLWAYAARKQVLVRDAAGQPRLDTLEHPSTVSGLAFVPNGKRLAVTHYGGASLWWTGQSGGPTRLNWAGSHLGVLWHPEGTHLMTTLQEPGLHGWRLKDSAEMQMSGYLTKIRSLGWTRRARYLVTAGADAILCWPFFGGGPWEKSPLELAGGPTILVTTVAPHPTEDVVAAGHRDGLVLIAPLDGGQPVILAEPEQSPISALAWSTDGRHLLFGTETGRLSWFPIPGTAPPRGAGPRGAGKSVRRD